MTLGWRSFAATLLTPRPANVPSSDSPKTPGGMPLEASGLVPALGTVSAAGSTAVVAVAAQVCGTERVPTRLARPITAVAADPLTLTGATGSGGGAGGSPKNGPTPWEASRSALIAIA